MARVKQTAVVVGSREYNQAEAKGYCEHGYPVGNCEACVASELTEGELEALTAETMSEDQDMPIEDYLETLPMSDEDNEEGEDEDALYDASETVPAAQQVVKTRKPRVAKEAKAPKEPKVPSPYAGLSPHQKNRAIALAKYGTRPGYTANDFRIHIEPTLRATIQAQLDGGKIRPSAKGKSHGGDRYLMGVAKAGWPVDAITIEYPDQQADKRAAVLAKKEADAKARELAKIEKELAKEAARQLAREAAEAEAQADVDLGTDEFGAATTL